LLAKCAQCQRVDYQKKCKSSTTITATTYYVQYEAGKILKLHNKFLLRQNMPVSMYCTKT